MDISGNGNALNTLKILEETINPVPNLQNNIDFMFSVKVTHKNIYLQTVTIYSLVSKNCYAKSCPFRRFQFKWTADSQLSQWFKEFRWVHICLINLSLFN